MSEPRPMTFVVWVVPCRDGGAQRADVREQIEQALGRIDDIADFTVEDVSGDPARARARR